MTEANSITIPNLRSLLHEIKDLRPDICVRFRLIGQMWQTNFLRVVSLTEKGINLHDEYTGKFVFIHDLSDVMQFELDQAFRQYRPHFHYKLSTILVY